MLGRRREDRRSGSVTRDTRQRLTDQISLQEERINISRGRSPSLLPSRRWSTILSPDTKTGGQAGARVVLSRPPSCPPTSLPSSRPPTCSAYSAALVRQSHRLRDRSVSPSTGQTSLIEKYAEPSQILSTSSILGLRSTGLTVTTIAGRSSRSTRRIRCSRTSCGTSL